MINLCNIGSDKLSIRSACNILNLAAEFIEKNKNSTEYPVVTISYAQTIDGSM
jgi:hypothetical protein